MIEDLLSKAIYQSKLQASNDYLKNKHCINTTK